MKISIKKRCPYCFSIELERIHRKWWMRLLIHSRYFECLTCKAHILVILNFLYIAQPGF